MRFAFRAQHHQLAASIGSLEKFVRDFPGDWPLSLGLPILASSLRCLAMFLPNPIQSRDLGHLPWPGPSFIPGLLAKKVVGCSSTGCYPNAPYEPNAHGRVKRTKNPWLQQGDSCGEIVVIWEENEKNSAVEQGRGAKGERERRKTGDVKPSDPPSPAKRNKVICGPRSGRHSQTAEPRLGRKPSQRQVAVEPGNRGLGRSWLFLSGEYIRIRRAPTPLLSSPLLAYSGLPSNKKTQSPT